MHLAYPYRVDSSGRTAQTGDGDHIREMLEQLLFTTPGERVNQPEFGCGLAQLVFAPNSPELVASTQYLVQSAVQRWLGHLIRAELVELSVDENKLGVTVQYVVVQNQERQRQSFELSF